MKKIIMITLIIIFLFIIQNLFHSISSLWQKQELLVNAKKELEQEKKDNKTLKDQLTNAKRPEYIEEQARDKLLLTKPGEQIVIVSRHLIVSDVKAEKKAEVLRPNWQQWWELFFGRE